VVVAGDGRLLGFDLNSGTARMVFAPAPGEGVTAVQALADGTLFVAQRGGIVEELRPGPDPGADVPVAELAPLTGVPSDPSALDVLEIGPLEVLVTNAGSDQVFVFGPSLSAPLAVREVTLPGLVPGGPVAETSSPREAPLTVLLTLVAGPLPGETAATADPTAGGSPTSGVSTPQLGVEASGSTPDRSAVGVQGAGDNGDERNDGTQAPAGEQPPSDADQDLDDILRRLDLGRPADDPGPVQLLPDPVAALWQVMEGSSEPVQAVVAGNGAAKPRAVWLVATAGLEQDATGPAVVAGQPAPEQGTPLRPAPVPAPEAERIPVTVEVGCAGAAWGETWMAAAAIGGLALWTERRLRGGDEPPERVRMNATGW
jgi:hypothetical protein